MIERTQEEKEKIANQKTEESKERIAHALNILEVVLQDIQYACEMMHWNDFVTVQIEEAATKLGFALATLTRWDADANEK